MKAENREKKKGRGRMRKIKALGMMFILSVSSAMLLTGCEERIKMDENKCAEIALEYLNNKYQKEFEVLDSSEVYKYIGSAGYAEVIVKDKADETENRYVVVIYPEGTGDEDDDGYYDSYKVVSDDYMCELVIAAAKDEIDKLLINAGISDFISRIYIDEINKKVGFHGFSSDFPIINENDFSLEQLLLDYHIDITCMLEMSENEFCDTLKDDIVSEFKMLISGDSIGFNISSYTEEVYRGRKELYEKDNTLFKCGRDNILVGIDNISFYVEDEEEENEFE